MASRVSRVPVAATMGAAGRVPATGASSNRSPGAGPRRGSVIGNQATLRFNDAQLLPTTRAIAARRIEIGAANAPEEGRATAIANASARGERIAASPVVRTPPPTELGLGAGRPLDHVTRGRLAPTFGDSLGEVRIHDDRAAARAANQLGANAFTLGGHIVFGHGNYQPGTPAGRHLLAHELGHAINADSRPIARCDGERDWDREVSRLTTTEIEAELQSVRARILSIGAREAATTPETVELEREQAALERALVERDRPRAELARTVSSLRRVDPLGVMVSPATVFAESMWAGFLSEVPPGTVREGAVEVILHADQFQLGYLAGVPVGLWHGLVNLIDGLWALVGLAAQAVIETSPMIQAAQFLYDPGGYTARLRRRQQLVRTVVDALYAFAREVARDPSIVIQMNSDLGFLLGQEAAHVYARFAAQSAYDQGQAIGDIAGQVLFEVLLEVILALATEGVGNLIRGLEAGAEGARHGGRLVAAIRRMLEASPALRRLLRALGIVEEGRTGVRAVERTAEAVEAVSAERRVTTTAETHVPEPPHARIVEEPRAPRTVDETPPARVAEEPHAPRTVDETPPTRAVEEPHTSTPPQTTAPHPPDPRALARARRAENFADVEPLRGHPAPDPLPPSLQPHYRYVTNPHPPPPRSLRRVVADDQRFAQLSVDTHGNIEYAPRGRPTPDVPFDAELATPLDVPSQAHLTGSEVMSDGGTVSESVAARREAQSRGDLAAMRRESERLGEAAGESYMRGRGTQVHHGGGSDTLDQVWRNSSPPPEFTVLEAKGGAGTNTSSRLDAAGVRYQQGTEGYLRSIIDGSLAHPPTARLDPSLARELQRALMTGDVEYIEVTQRIASDGSLLPPVARRYF